MLEAETIYDCPQTRTPAFSQTTTTTTSTATMSSTNAPSYNHATQHSPPTLQYDDHDLHRYVTDEGPSNPKRPVERSDSIPPQPALIVSESRLARS